MIVLFGWVIIYFGLTIRFKPGTILLWSPILVILNYMSRSFITSGISGYNRNEVLLNYLLLFYLILISFFHFKSQIKKLDKLTKTTLFFILFLLVLCFTNSSDPWWSFKRTLPLITSFFVFITLYNSKNININYIFHSLFVFALLINIYFIILSLLKIGSPMGEYSSDLVRWGSISFYEGYGLAFIVSISAIILRFIKNKLNKLILIVVTISAISFFLLIAKRMYLIIIFWGVLLYIFYLFRFNFIRTKTLIQLLIFCLVAFFIFQNAFSSFLENRVQANLNLSEVEKVGRYVEFMAYPEIFATKKNSTRFLLLGEELFNSQGRYRIIESIIKDKERLLHNDFAHLLYGSGFIGLFTYLSIFFLTFKKTFSFRKQLYSSNDKFIYIAVMILLTGLLLSGIADGIMGFLNRFIVLYAIGGILSYLKNTKKYVSAR